MTNTYDVIIVGFGGSGAAAAIEAADNGAKVLVLDRAYGGGATALSGGIYYTGGGTRHQLAAGEKDTPDDMFAYLSQEVGDAVQTDTLRTFCDESVNNMNWMESHGVPFDSSLVPYKTSYPTDEYYLYHSGNEKAWPFKTKATPFARGHRAVAKGMASGKALYNPLKQSALRKGVTFFPAARVHELITDDSGAVTGVKYRSIPPGSRASRIHRELTLRPAKLENWAPAMMKGLRRRVDKLWADNAVDNEAHAPAVILAAGGFAYNREMRNKYVPEYNGVLPLGTPGDDGTGIQLGESVGGVTGRMNKFTSWRFLSPPVSLTKGLSLGLNGRRVANEDLYGARFSEHMIHEHDAKAWLLFDANTWAAMKAEISYQGQIFHKIMMRYLLTFGHKSGHSIKEVLGECGIDVDAGETTVAEYNTAIASGQGDPAHKDESYCPPIVQAPFYAINISSKNSPLFPAPGLSLGGLVVDESSGLVKKEDGSTITGLYAVGRNAVGIASNGYISGLSIADCIFSGRRAGKHAADATTSA